MELNNIETKPFETIFKGWALVTSGDSNKFNTMTVNWGAMGTLWNKPIIIIYVKPIRYTHDFLTGNEYFTVSMYDEEYRKDLLTLGTLSGRDVDKVSKTKLHPKFLEKSVTFMEANRTYVLKKIYSAKLVKDEVPDFAIEKFYENEDVHTVFVGEVVEVL